jgi:penicillin-binding protein 2
MDIPVDAVLSYQEGMQMVAHYNTIEMRGTGAQIFQHYPIQICAKTGTAETGINGQDNNGAFLCYAPADDPQIAIAVYGEKSGSGSVMGNVAKGILDVFFDVGKAAEITTYENTVS